MKHRVAVVGLGGIAQKGHLPVLSSMNDIELLFYGRHEKKVEAIAEQFRINRYTSHLEQLLDWKADCVFILTPVPTHYELASFFLNSGLDVFIEKPATSTSVETKKLATLAENKKRILMIAFNRRYAPLSIKAKEQWGNRKVTMANLQKSRTKPGFLGLFNHVNEELVHVIDMLRFLCGEGKSLFTSSRLDKDGMVLEVATHIGLESGGLATITASLQAGHWYEHYELHGEHATLDLNCFYDLEVTTEKGTQTWKEPYDSSWTSNLFGRGFINQIDHFFNCIETRQSPKTDAWDSLKTQMLVEDIIKKNNN